jgi:hypothetical protein
VHTHINPQLYVAAAPQAMSLMRAVAFLQEIGLVVELVPGAKGFVAGVLIVDGGLHVDPTASVSGLLHEAAHIAIMPAKYRHLLNGDVSGGLKAMFDDMATMKIDPDGPLYRAAIQCSDPEATAWAFAAGVHLGLPVAEIIMDSEYAGEGASIRSMLMARQYYGINGLAHAGLCLRGFMGTPETRYPVMTRWLQK